MAKLQTHQILLQACTDAIAERTQTALDNMDCAPDFAASAQDQAERFLVLHAQLRDQSTPFTPAAILRLPVAMQDALCEVLHVAALARLAVIDAFAHTRVSVADERRWRRRYQALLLVLSPPVPARPALEIPTHLLSSLVPDGAWETLPDGGRVFRPKLPQ